MQVRAGVLADSLPQCAQQAGDGSALLSGRARQRLEIEPRRIARRGQLRGSLGGREAAVHECPGQGQLDVEHRLDEGAIAELVLHAASPVKTRE